MKEPLLTCMDWSAMVSDAPLLTSFAAGWQGMQLVHYRQSDMDWPAVANPEHMLMIPLGKQAFDLAFDFEGDAQVVSYQEPDLAAGCIALLPSGLSHRLDLSPTAPALEWIHCYLEPTFLAQVADDAVNTDRIELLLTLKKADLLLYQMGLALRSNLAENGLGSRFYADSMATMLAAHLLRYYSNCQHCFRDHEDGLPQHKLQRALDYIRTHLGEDLSLNTIATELGMSQYYFCNLFKRSTGMTPHQYLIRQRVEQAKRWLKQTDQSITAIALVCGFANQSHFAKCFRQHTGMTPKQFRQS